MAENTSGTLGRLPFEVRESDRDYSALIISDRFLAKSDIEKSFFHGSVLENCDFEQVKLNNTEFSETTAKSCHFDVVDLSGSDFIDCRFEETVFSECDFEKGEWRESTFVNCKFLNCNFTHTTTTLCKFVACDFDNETISRIENRSIYFNIFQRSVFSKGLTDQVFFSRNFGVLAIELPESIISKDICISIEQICLLNNLGILRSIDIIDATEAICDSLSKKGPKRNSTLKFLGNIFRTLTEERRISATSLMCLEAIVIGLANTTEDQDLFKVVMDTIVEIRNALVLVANEIQDFDPQQWEGQALSAISIFFPETYSKNQVQLLRDALAETAGTKPDNLAIEGIRHGSTYIELATSGAVSIAGLLTAFNFILRQAEITVTRIKKLQKAIRSPSKITRLSKVSKDLVNVSARAPAILKAGAVSPVLAPLQKTVRRSGNALAQMDEKAKITILVE
jgi:hypothetical protein